MSEKRKYFLYGVKTGNRVSEYYCEKYKADADLRPMNGDGGNQYAIGVAIFYQGDVLRTEPAGIRVIIPSLSLN